MQIHKVKPCRFYVHWGDNPSPKMLIIYPFAEFSRKCKIHVTKFQYENRGFEATTESSLGVPCQRLELAIIVLRPTRFPIRRNISITSRPAPNAIPFRNASLGLPRCILSHTVCKKRRCVSRPYLP